MKKVLDITREITLTAASMVLWVVNLTAVITILYSVFDIQNYYVQLIRTLMNINEKEIQKTFLLLVFISLVVITYLLIVGYINRLRYKEVPENEK